jgi:hypothetical protein
MAEEHSSADAELERLFILAPKVGSTNTNIPNIWIVETYSK